MTRDELVETLRLHGAEIVEADEWRPLAGHVLELVEHGLLRPTAPSEAEIQEARGFLATMLQNDPTERVVLAALDALAREPGLEAKVRELEKAVAVAGRFAFQQGLGWQQRAERAELKLALVRELADNYRTMTALSPVESKHNFNFAAAIDRALALGDDAPAGGEGKR